MQTCGWTYFRGGSVDHSPGYGYSVFVAAKPVGTVPTPELAAAILKGYGVTEPLPMPGDEAR